MVLLLEGVDGRDGDRLLEFAEPSNRCTCDENVNKDVGDDDIDVNAVDNDDDEMVRECLDQFAKVTDSSFSAFPALWWWDGGDGDDNGDGELNVLKEMSHIKDG